MRLADRKWLRKRMDAGDSVTDGHDYMIFCLLQGLQYRSGIAVNDVK
jgi:hypothetical protein